MSVSYISIYIHKYVYVCIYEIALREKYDTIVTHSETHILCSCAVLCVADAKVIDPLMTSADGNEECCV